MTCIPHCWRFLLTLSTSRISSPLVLSLFVLPCLFFFFSQTVLDICSLLPQTQVPELVVSLVALAVLIVVKEINDCYRQKLPLPIPIELVVVSLPFSFSFILSLPVKQQVYWFMHPAGSVLTPMITLDPGNAIVAHERGCLQERNIKRTNDTGVTLFFLINRS